MSQPLSEFQLVGLVKSFLARPNGTATAEERLACLDFYNIYDPIIRKRIRRIHIAWHVIDDLSQEVWTKATKRLPTFVFKPEVGSVAGWLVKIADNVARRHARRRSSVGPASLSSEMADELPDLGLGPDIENAWTQFKDELQRLMESLRVSLSERDHRIALMRFLEDYSVAEIARELNLTDDCVSSVLYRVILNLRELLRQRGECRPEEGFA